MDISGGGFSGRKQKVATCFFKLSMLKSKTRNEQQQEQKMCLVYKKTLKEIIKGPRIH